jgi:putative colanic acid biosynthesis acetyltransferase WcaF
MANKRTLDIFTGVKLNFYLRLRLVFWFWVQNLVFKSALIPSTVRGLLLQAFGASIGRKVVLRRGVRVHFPWNLEIGDNCWIGEEVWFINHEKITIGSDVCISQRSIICSGGHDYRSAPLKYVHKPVTIKDGAWVCLDAKVLPGITIGECSVVSAGEIVRNSLPDYSMLVAGQVRPIDPPK